MNLLPEGFTKRAMKRKFVLHLGIRFILNLKAASRMFCFQAQDSPERLEKFYLSKKLRDAVTEVVTADETLKDIQNYSELENYRLGVIADFANGPEIDSLSASCKVEFPDAAAVLKGIYDGEVDFGVLDQGVKEYLMSDNVTLYPAPALTYYRPLYVMFREEKVRDDFDAAGEQA